MPLKRHVEKKNKKKRPFSRHVQSLGLSDTSETRNKNLWQHASIDIAEGFAVF
jgi:hypothetical protein